MFFKYIVHFISQEKEKNERYFVILMHITAHTLISTFCNYLMYIINFLNILSFNYQIGSDEIFRKELTCRSTTVDAHRWRRERIGSILGILGETNHTRRVEGIRDLIRIK